MRWNPLINYGILEGESSENTNKYSKDIFFRDVDLYDAFVIL